MRQITTRNEPVDSERTPLFVSAGVYTKYPLLCVRCSTRLCFARVLRPPRLTPQQGKKPRAGQARLRCRSYASR